jgi:hypothetical protein
MRQWGKRPPRSSSEHHKKSSADDFLWCSELPLPPLRAQTPPATPASSNRRYWLLQSSLVKNHQVMIFFAKDNGESTTVEIIYKV